MESYPRKEVLHEIGLALELMKRKRLKIFPERSGP